MHKRYIVKLLAMLAAAALLCACGGAGAGSSGAVPPPAQQPSATSPASPSTQPVRMGVVMPGGDHSFTILSRRHAKAELEALAAAGDFEYTLESGSDVAAQQRGVEAVLATRPDVVVLWPVEAEPLRPAAHTILDSGARLILFERLIQNFYPTAALVGDHETIGRWTAEYLQTHFAPRLEAGGEVAYLHLVGGADEAGEGVGAFDATLAASPHAERFTQLGEDMAVEWSAPAASVAVSAFLAGAAPEELERLACVVTQNDEMAEGVLAALNAWREEHPDAAPHVEIITGVGARRETLDRFEEAAGPQLLTYYYSPSYVRQAIRLAAAAARGAQYDGADITGQTFYAATIEVDAATRSAYRLSREYAERYSV